MSSEYFRIVRGLELDERVRILQGAIAPGATTDTNNAPVGSFYLNTSTGIASTKILPGTGVNKWAIVGTGVGTTLELYGENPVSASAALAQGNNSIAIGSGAITEPAAEDSIAIGNQSRAVHRGAQMYSNGRFGGTGDAQAGKYLLRNTTTNAVTADLFLDGVGGSERLVLPDDSTWSFMITVTGHRTDVTDGHAGYTASGVIFRRGGAASTLFQGNPVKTVIAESNAAWNINITANQTFGSLNVSVTGQAAKTIRWVALIETVEVTN